MSSEEREGNKQAKEPGKDRIKSGSSLLRVPWKQKIEWWGPKRKDLGQKI